MGCLHNDGRGGPCGGPGCKCANEDWEGPDDFIDDRSGFLNLVLICTGGVLGVVALAVVVGVTWLLFGFTTALIAGIVALVPICFLEWWFLR